MNSGDITPVIERERLQFTRRPWSEPSKVSRPIEALDDDKPIDLLAAGDYKRVTQVIAELEYPGAS